MKLPEVIEALRATHPDAVAEYERVLAGRLEGVRELRETRLALSEALNAKPDGETLGAYWRIRT